MSREPYDPNESSAQSCAMGFLIAGLLWVLIFAGLAVIVAKLT